jgi:Tol biopolymer transport system component
MRAELVFVAPFVIVACSPAVRRPLSTTDAATHLEQVTHSDTNELDPAVSPDGRAIAYEVASSLEAPPHVEVMALDPAAAGRVEYSSKDKPGLEPAWMPDGSGLVFVSQTHGTWRGIVQTVGSAPDKIAFAADTVDPYLATEWPAVSPDGRTVALSLVNVHVFGSGWRTTHAYDRVLALEDLLGTELVMLGAGTSPAWSHDGKRLAFARQTSGHAHLFVANADGSGVSQITDGSADDEEPSWSPDGRAIVFCSAHRGDVWSQANLFVVRPDGSGLVQLTEGDRVSCRPTWARDNFVYFHANATDRFHIWRLLPTLT